MSGPPTNSERNRDDQPHDRLTDIADIGRARQQWLNDLEIYTFSDLADSSAEDLANRLQEADHSVKLDMIQQWIEQAKVFAEEQDWNRWSQHRDPFTDLEGINAARQQWLYSLEIYTFSDLAESSAEDIESRLRVEEHSATVAEIQEWIDQSKVFVHEQSETTDGDILDSDIEQNNDTIDEESPPTVSLEAKTSTDGPGPESSEADPIDSPLNTDWQSLASFVVTHQTRQVSNNTETRIQVHQAETDIQQVWPLGNIEQLPSWILARIEELSLPALVQTNSETEPEAEQEGPLPILMRVEQLRFLQPPQIKYVINTERPSQMIGPIQGNRPFMSEVSLSLNVEEFDNPDDTLNLQLQAFISNRITGNSFSMDSSHSVL
ncbi:MAG: hypothetical protein AAGA83_16330, partial [Cyanobacteria bacterium P01_F01_bin.116]